ncbi:MAG TPA: M20/M25/M40 family metallo-hydrolase, partial [Bacillales bacterium]|nr:M20/M25/M40 family metallo-hydrolase [Bacillales bacterium]
GEPLVATVGQIDVEPNTVNVIPGKVTFTLDVRHTARKSLHEFTDRLIERLRQMAEQNGVGIQIDMWMDEDPVPLNPHIVKVIQKQCEDNGTPYKLMHSGAGHDTQVIAPYIPAAMLFVPSHNGISHSPHEYTELEDLAEGVNVLTHTLYQLAYSEECVL